MTQTMHIFVLKKYCQHNCYMVYYVPRQNRCPSDIINISSTFEVLESKTLGVSLGMNNDNIVVIKIDPKNWSKSSITKRWYLIYHELGHDVLNLKHGEGGKMMFTFSDREYKWEEFFEDKEYMFKYFKKNL